MVYFTISMSDYELTRSILELAPSTDASGNAKWPAASLSTSPHGYSESY